MKNIHILFILFLLSCHSNHLENDNASSILLLSNRDLDDLKYVTIHARNHEKPLKFLYSTEQTDLLLPIVCYFDSISLTHYRENINNFCILKNATGINCDSFFLSYTERIRDAIERTHMAKIQSNRKLGSFIIFTLDDESDFIYKFDTNVRHPYWRSFFDSAKSVKTNWYFRANKKW